MPRAAYYAQQSERVERHRPHLANLRRHSFMNVGFEFEMPPIDWSRLVSAGRARVDHSGCYSRLVALICGHDDAAIKDYLAALPPGHLALPQPIMERVLREYLAGNETAAIAEVDRIIAPDGPPVAFEGPQQLFQALNNPAPEDAWPSRQTRKEAAFFCAAYLNDAERFDHWATSWAEYCDLTPHEAMTAQRLLNRPGHYSQVLQRITTTPHTFAAHLLIAETTARQLVQDEMWVAENQGPRFCDELVGVTSSSHRAHACLTAATANEWCRMASHDFAYCSMADLIPDTVLRSYIERAEEAALVSLRSSDWRLCATTYVWTLGDLEGAHRCMMKATSLAQGLHEWLACARLCRWYGIGPHDEWVEILVVAESMPVTPEQFMLVIEEWDAIGEHERASGLRRRIGAVAHEDDLAPQPPDFQIS